MKQLTQKQENFCLAYIETGNMSEAYRRSYNTENMKPETVNRNAKTLYDSSKIAARIAELRKPAQEKALLTLDEHLARLAELSQRAGDEGKYGPAVQAEIARGKAVGLYVERIQQDVSGTLNIVSEFGDD